MSNGQKHPNTYCEDNFCFDIACSFHRLYIARSSMQEPPKCLWCGLPNCAHTSPDLPDLVNPTPAPPRLYPQLPSALPTELSDDSSIESIEESLKTTDAECRGTVPASPQATAMAMAGARAQANPTVERGPHRRRHERPVQFTPPSGNGCTKCNSHNSVNLHRPHSTSRRDNLEFSVRRTQKTKGELHQTKKFTI